MTKQNELQNAYSEINEMPTASGIEIFNKLAQVREDDLPPADRNKVIWDKFLFLSYNIETRRSNQGIYNFDPSFAIDSNVLAHWEAMAQSSQNIIARIFYSGMVWEYSIEQRGRRNPKLALILIASAIDAANSRLFQYQFHCQNILEKAMAIAGSMKKTSEQIAIRDAVIKYEDAIAVDELCGLWGFSYQILVGTKQDKAVVPQVIEDEIVNKLKMRLDRLTHSGLDQNADSKYYAALIASDLLIDYYSSDRNEIESILNKLFLALQTASFHSESVSAHHYMMLFQRSKKYGLNALADKIGPFLLAANAKVNATMKPIKVATKITYKEIEGWAEEYIGNSFEESIAGLISHDFPDYSALQVQLETHLKEHVGYSLAGRAIHDHKGRKVGQIGTYPEDSSGLLVLKSTEYIFNEITVYFRYIAMKMLIQRFTANVDMFLEYIFRSKYVPADRRDIFACGIKAYLNEDYISAIHVLVPQVEEVIRTIVEKSGGNVYSASRAGAMQLKTLESIIDEPSAQSVLGEFSGYLKIILTDSRGLNIRNNLCHGFYPPAMINCPVADLLVMTLLALTKIAR
jgi:hypothetical protein